MALTSFDPAARRAALAADIEAFLSNGKRIHELAENESAENSKPSVVRSDHTSAKEIENIVRSVRAISNKFKNKTSLYETVGKQYGRDRTTIARIFKAYNSKVPE